jgi:serine/threonine-protein kinase
MGGPDAEYREWALRRVGTTLKDTYRIDQLIGIGGMASVYAATHRDGRRVALKVLHSDLSERADLRTRFRREAMAANAVNHPGVVTILDDDVADDGAAFIVMELIEGQVVEHLWQNLGRRLPAPLVLGMAREVCEVLIAAHRAGIVHRDIKPENLILTNDGKVKVLDFGLARLRDLTQPSDTHTGMIFGTPQFMPPEQAAGRTSQIDERTDLWALGATMFTLLSGVVVHEGESLQEIVMLAATYPARPLADVLPDAHPVLTNLVDRSLTWDKEKRWPNAVAMRDAICAACVTLFGEERPELLGADELTLTGGPKHAGDGEEDATRTDQTLATMEPPVPAPDDVTQRHASHPVIPIGADADDHTDVNVTNVRQPAVVAGDPQEKTSVMNIDVRGSSPRIAITSDLDEPQTKAMPRAPVTTARTTPPARGPMLPWILAAIATVVALIAVWVAVSARSAR